jgi:hypothetical protein
MRFIEIYLDGVLDFNKSFKVSKIISAGTPFSDNAD